MDISSITAGSQNQSVWQSRQQQFQQNLQALGTSLQAGDLAGAQQDFRTLLQRLSGSVNVANSSTAAGTQGGSVAQDLAALKSALQSGNLSDAQHAYQTLTQDLQTQKAHHHHHHHKSQATTSPNSVMAPMSVGTAGTTVNVSV